MNDEIKPSEEIAKIIKDEIKANAPGTIKAAMADTDTVTWIVVIVALGYVIALADACIQTKPYAMDMIKNIEIAASALMGGKLMQMKPK